MRLVSVAPIVILVVALLAYPFVAEQAYLTYVLILILTYSIVGLYYNLLLGYMGIPFLGPMVFYAVGGYTAGYLARIHVDPFVGVFVGSVFAAGSSLAFSLPSMRVRGLYMALYSLVFTLFFRNLISRNDIAWLFAVFQGGIGVSSIPDINLFGFQWRANDGLPYYYLILGLLVASAFFLKWVLDSKFGTAFRAARDAEVYASTLGIGVFRVKIIGFAISGFFIGLAGATLTMFYGAIGLTILDTSNMLLFFSMIVFGGLGTFFGPAVGAVILVPLNNYLTTFGALRLLAWGIAVLAVVLIAPEGIVGRLQRYIRRPFRKKA